MGQGREGAGVRIVLSLDEERLSLGDIHREEIRLLILFHAPRVCMPLISRIVFVKHLELKFKIGTESCR